MFSIIVPVYNAERHLNRLFDSVLGQNFEDFELIMVDDGSTDTSLEIMQNYKKTDPRIKIIAKRNEGPGLARQCGFELATNELLFFLDSDDHLPDAGVLDSIYKVYENRHFEILFLKVCCESPNGISYLNSLKNLGLSEGFHNIAEIQDTIIGGGLYQKIFLRSKMKSDFFYSSYNFEDKYTTYKYLNTCKTFNYLDRPCYVINYLDNYDSLTKTMSTDKIRNAVDIITKIFEDKSLLLSKQLQAFDYYIYAMRLLYTKEISEYKREDILHIKSLLHYFKGKAVSFSLKHYSVKRLLFYWYTLFFMR